MENNGNPGLPENFLENFKEENRSFITSKGFKSADDMAAALMAADNMVSLPTEKSTEEELNAFYTKLGRPESAEKYNFNIPEGQSDEFAKSVAPLLFKAGLTQKQLDTLVPDWNNFVAARNEALTKAAQEEFTKATEELKKEWGANYEANETLAQRATQALGLTAEELDGLVKAKGTAWVYKTMVKLSKAIGDDKIKGTSGGRTEVNLSDPKEAQAEIARLMKDPQFAADFVKGEAKAKEKWDKLHKVAYQGGANNG